MGLGRRALRLGVKGVTGTVGLAGSAAVGSNERSVRTFIRHWAGIAILWLAAVLILQIWPGPIGAVLLLVAIFATARGLRVPFGGFFRALFTPAGLIFFGIVAGTILLVVYRTDLIAKIPGLATIPAGNLVLVAIAASATGLIVVALSHHVGAGARERLMREYGARIAQVLAVPINAVEASRLTKSRAGSLTLAPTPPGGALMLGKGASAEQRLAHVMPEFVINERSSGPQQIVFDPIETSLEAQTARERLAESDGLVIGIEEVEAGELPRQIWHLSEDAAPTAAPRIQALAESQGMTLISWAPYQRTATVGKLEPQTLAVRNSIAGFLGVPSHEVAVNLTVNPLEGYVSEVEVLRAPPVLDKVKRRTQWLALAASVLPAVPATIWRFEDRTSEGGAIKLRRLQDPLKDILTLADFNERFRNRVTDPSESWRSFPIAIREDGSPVEYQTFHTLGVGQTGAGKGSIWWSIFNGLVPSMRAGLVECYAIDPKGAEAIGEDGRPLGVFEKVATTAHEWAELVDELVTEMNSRKGRGRKPPVTREHPLRILLIDELSALSKLDTDKKRAQDVMAGLLAIASQGRSLNVLIVGLVQAPQKDMVGDLRDFMPMRVALRTGTKIETDLVLGDGATDAGAEAHLIPIAAPGNGYASAGTGFMRVEGDPAPVRIRLPFTDDRQIEEWSAEFPLLRAARAAEKQSTEVVMDSLDLSDLDFSAFDAPPPSTVELKPAPTPLIQW
ncbi:MAG: traSA [Microbacteriaceae bacterium]|nr:traSA [Microbacteriaceae bacterium]